MNARRGLLFSLVLGLLTLLPLHVMERGGVRAADLGTITFTRNTGMGISSVAGQNTLIQNVDQTGTQCINTPGAACLGNGANGRFTNTSDPFFPDVMCVDTATFCQARFDPGLPEAFTAVDNQFGKTGVPCGLGDLNGDPANGKPFPYDCNSQGLIHQIVPKGLIDKANPIDGACITRNTATGRSPSNTCFANNGGEQISPANFRMGPPTRLLVGQPFQVYSSFKLGNIRVHHIEDGFQGMDGTPNSADETGCGADKCGTGVTRLLFVIDVKTDAGGHITDDGSGRVQANGTFTLEMDDRHVQGNCQIPKNFSGFGSVRPNAGLGSFQSGESGLLLDAKTQRPACFDKGGDPCPTGQVLMVRAATFCPGDDF